jgi:MFS superfamily sulfate permease-like transporter
MRLSDKDAPDLKNPSGQRILRPMETHPAGTIVGIVALPLAIAFAIASGVKPEQGLFTAIVAGLVVSVFGGSRVQIAGPTGVFIVIVYGIVRTYGYDGLAVATFMAGVILSAMFFIRRMAEVSQVTPLTKDLRESEEVDDEGVRHGALPQGVEVFEVFGTLFFGAVEKFTETMREFEKPPKVFILETRNLLAIDATGIRAIEDLLGTLKGTGTKFILSGIHKQPLFALTQVGLP